MRFRKFNLLFLFFSTDHGAEAERRSIKGRNKHRLLTPPFLPFLNRFLFCWNSSFVFARTDRKGGERRRFVKCQPAPPPLPLGVS